MPRHAPPLTGRVFGRLTVGERAENTADGASRWWVSCDCRSPPKIVRGTALAHGQMRSCGCARRATGESRTPRTAPEAMLKEVFGALRPVELLPGLNRNQGRRWRCLCDPTLGGCGAETIARAKDLRSGNTKSCGCWARRGGNWRDGRKAAPGISSQVRDSAGAESDPGE